MTRADELNALAERLEKAGLSDAKHAASNALYAEHAFYKLSVAKMVRAQAVQS